MVLREAAAADAIVRTPGGRIPLRAVDDLGSFLQHILVGISLPARLARGGFSGTIESGHSTLVPGKRRRSHGAPDHQGGGMVPEAHGEGECAGKSEQAQSHRHIPQCICRNDAGDTLLSSRRAPDFARQTRQMTQMTTRCVPLDESGLTKPQNGSNFSVEPAKSEV